MSNFAFLKAEWPDIHEAAHNAERYALSDPRAACFYARYTLEKMVEWLFEHDRVFGRVYDDNLSALLTSPTFRRHVPPAVYQKAEAVRRLGNQAVHRARPIKAREAVGIVNELYHVLYWLGRTYTRRDPAAIPTHFDEALLPQPVASGQPQTLARLQKMAAALVAKDKQVKAQAQQLADYKAQLARLQAQVETAKAANAVLPDTHDYSEADTREIFIDVYLREAGWEPAAPNVAEYKVTGMPNKQGVGYADYVLWGDDGLPLAVVEAKRTGKDKSAGRQQAKLYADCLEQMHGRRPLIYYTNGYEIELWDDSRYPPRPVQGFYTKDKLQLLIQRRTSAADPAQSAINKKIVDRYYQEEAIRRVAEHFNARHRKALLVMATGTGKTRAAIALCDLLLRCNWAKRILFLADRTALVKQAVGAFKKHLPAANPINLLEDKEAKESRVVVSTYHTMLGLIDETKAGGEKLFGVGHFDLVIIDEAHRSVYAKFGAIFDYFDSLLLGLTATPKDDVDRNTYRLFELEDGVPTYAYDLEQAVADGFLTPPSPFKVPLKFVREGIKYDDLSDEEKAEWDLIEWDESGRVPDKVDPAALNKWLFNKDTVDKVLQTLMAHGLKVQGGDRLGKTIIFAKNHDHADFIQQRFNAHYPHLAGQFARVVDYQESYAQSLIENFAKPDNMPHIAISVDMLDTGIDVPEVVNLVFFKPVHSKTKFWQMLGRGTRLCPNLFGPGRDKNTFAVFDYCQNFEFFNVNPKGIETRPPTPLSQRIFNLRLELLAYCAPLKSSDPELARLAQEVADTLHRQVAAMPPDNFIVRPHRQYVDPFTRRERWDNLSQSDLNNLSKYVSGLPTQLAEEHETAKGFDALLLQAQVALLENAPRFTRLRDQIIDLAAQLEEKANIPAVQAHLELIRQAQQEMFWTGITLPQLELVRRNLRHLLHLIEQSKQAPIFTDFEDELGELQEVALPYLTGGVNVAQYRKKVEQFIRAHEDYVVIQKIRWAIPLNQEDLRQLEAFLLAADDTGRPELAAQLYGSRQNLGAFIRRLVGLDRKAAKEKFAGYLDGQNFTADQIQFVNFIIDHLTQNGTIERDILFDRPFTDIHELGLDGLFANGQANELLAVIETINQSVYPVAA